MNQSYFRKIDRLRSKHERGRRLCLREFLWIKWAEGHLTAAAVGFVRWLRKHREPLEQRVYVVWNAVWDAYLKSDSVMHFSTDKEYKAMLRVLP